MVSRNINGCGDIGMETCGHRFFNVSIHCVGAEGNDGYIPGFIQSLQLFECLDAVHSRQVDVHQYQVWDMGSCQFDSKFRFVGG